MYSAKYLTAVMVFVFCANIVARITMFWLIRWVSHP